MEKGPEVPSYRKLIVWQRAHEMLLAVLEETKQFPPSEEARIVKSQLLRAAMSVPANIVEGYGGQRGKSFTRYLRVSRGSAWEADYWLLLARDQHFIAHESYQRLKGLCGEVIAILTSAIRKGEASK